MKKTISFFLSVLVLLLSLSFSVMALADNTMKIECESVTAKAGETVSVDLKVSDNPGFMALNLALLYDKENLELTEAVNKLPGFVMNNESSFIWDGGNNYIGDGTLATLSFKVKETAKDGDYEIKVRFFEASDYDGNSVFANTESGIIKVSSKSSEQLPEEPELPQSEDMIIYADSVTAKAGETVTVDLKIKKNPGFMALNLALLYDKENLELTEAANKLPGFVMSAESAFVWDGGNNYIGDGTLATLSIKVKETAKDGDYEIKVRVFEASDYDGNSVNAIGVPGKITVKTAAADLDGDGVLDTGDADFLADYLIGKKELTEEQKKKADLNGDGVIDISDCVMIMILSKKK